MSPKNNHIKRLENWTSNTMAALRNISKLSLYDVRSTKVLNAVLFSLTAFTTIQIGTTKLASEYKLKISMII